MGNTHVYLDCIAIICDIQYRIVGYALTDCKIYKEADLAEKVKAMKIIVDNLKLKQDDTLKVIDTDKIKYETSVKDNADKFVNTTFRRIDSNDLSIQLQSGEYLRFLNKELFDKYKNKKFTKVEFKDNNSDLKTIKFLNKAALLYGSDSIKPDYVMSNIGEKNYIYLIKENDRSTIMYIPSYINEIEYYLLRTLLEELRGTLKVMGCESLERGSNIFRNMTNLEHIDLSQAKLNKLYNLEDMFYGVKAKTVRLSKIAKQKEICLARTFSSTQIDKVYIDEIEAEYEIDLNEMFSYSKINGIHMEKVDTNNCLVNMRFMFHRAKVNLLDISKLTIKYNLENYELMSEGYMYSVFSNGDICKPICNCEYINKMYNRRDNKKSYF